jgi:hypothetical protein
LLGNFPKEGYAMVLRGKRIALLLAGLSPLLLFPMVFAQEIQWICHFGTEKYDFAYDVSVDVAGNIYVVDWTSGTLLGQEGKGGSDAFIEAVS